MHGAYNSLGNPQWLKEERSFTLLSEKPGDVFTALMVWGSPRPRGISASPCKSSQIGFRCSSNQLASPVASGQVFGKPKGYKYSFCFVLFLFPILNFSFSFFPFDNILEHEVMSVRISLCPDDSKQCITSCKKCVSRRCT